MSDTYNKAEETTWMMAPLEMKVGWLSSGGNGSNGKTAHTHTETTITPNRTHDAVRKTEGRTVMSAVTQTDPLRVEMKGFKLTHPERGQKLSIFRVCRRMCGFYGQQTHGARTTRNQQFDRAGLGDSQDRPAIEGQPQYGPQLRADFETA